MAKRTPRNLACVAAVFALAALRATAGTFEESYAAAVKNSPPGVTFEIKPSQATFHMGEVIPVELGFSSREKDHWQLDMGLYDRSGRLHEDAYHLDPADGAQDPLADYFASGAFMGGGLRSMPPALTEKPVVLRFDLNEWQRIDKPGKYRLYAVSTRRCYARSLRQQAGPRGVCPQQHARTGTKSLGVYRRSSWRRSSGSVEVCPQVRPS